MLQMVEVTMSRARKAATGAYTDNTTAEEKAHRGASGCGAAVVPSPRRPTGCQLVPC